MERDKEVISAFEYAINEAIDPKMNEGLRAETRSEELERRRKALLNKAKGLRILTPQPKDK